jgi:stage II sporulation protein P
VVIDGHRDAIGGEDTKVKPTAIINGKKAAQVMILAGCQTGSVEGFPHWEENFRFCLQLQKQLEADYPDLARPLLFKACKYNFDLLNGSILIEIGTDANTLEEATYSAELLGQALVKILQ